LFLKAAYFPTVVNYASTMFMTLALSANKISEMLGSDLPGLGFSDDADGLCVPLHLVDVLGPEAEQQLL
jgi:hypothetical protein